MKNAPTGRDPVRATAPTHLPKGQDLEHQGYQPRPQEPRTHLVGCPMTVHTLLNQPPDLLIFTGLALAGAWSIAYHASLAVIELVFHTWTTRTTKTADDLPEVTR